MKNDKLNLVSIVSLWNPMKENDGWQFVFVHDNDSVLCDKCSFNKGYSHSVSTIDHKNCDLGQLFRHVPIGRSDFLLDLPSIREKITF